MNPSLPFALAAALLSLLPGPAAACEPDESASAPLYLAIETPVRDKAGRQVGKGRYSYRFVVRDPQRVSHPYRRGRYQVNTDQALFPDGRTVFRGVTDARGRTATFRFAQAVPLEEWFVQPLSGKGELGESFRLSADGDCKHDMVHFPYMLDGALGPIFCGAALPGGTTVRYMLPMMTNVRIHTGFASSGCRKLQARINPVMARPDPARRIAGLQRLLDAPGLAAHHELIAEKIEAQLIRYGTLAQLKALLARQLDEAGKSAHAQSDVYNSLGYALVAQDPPRHIEFAKELLDRSLALDENLFNTDSKAWVLHRSGDNEAALVWVERSLAMYGRQCNDTERGAYQESLAHRGMILWALKQPDAALTEWAKAELTGDGGGGWANYLPPWRSIEPLIQARTAELRAAGFKDPLCSEDKPENDEDQESVAGQNESPAAPPLRQETNRPASDSADRHDK